MSQKALKEGNNMKQSIRFKKRSQVTIPKEMAEALDLNEGDMLEARLENGKIVLVPTINIPADQAWFWTEKWQEKERQADEDIEAGRVKGPYNVDETLEQLKRLDEEKNP